MLEGVGAHCRALALGRRQVLDRDRDAVQRADVATARDGALRGASELDRLVLVDEAEAVEPRIDLSDPGEAGLDDLDRRELALTDAAGELVRRREAEVEIGAAQRTTSTSHGAW
jgi:hypothetical protein